MASPKKFITWDGKQLSISEVAKKTGERYDFIAKCFGGDCKTKESILARVNNKNPLAIDWDGKKTSLYRISKITGQSYKYIRFAYGRGITTQEAMLVHILGKLPHKIQWDGKNLTLKKVAKITGELPSFIMRAWKKGARTQSDILITIRDKYPLTIEWDGKFILCSAVGKLVGCGGPTIQYWRKNHGCYTKDAILEKVKLNLEKKSKTMFRHKKHNTTKGMLTIDEIIERHDDATVDVRFIYRKLSKIGAESPRIWDFRQEGYPKVQKVVEKKLPLGRRHPGDIKVGTWESVNIKCPPAGTGGAGRYLGY